MLRVAYGRATTTTPSDINYTEYFIHDKWKGVFNIYIYDFHILNKCGNRSDEKR